MKRSLFLIVLLGNALAGIALQTAFAQQVTFPDLVGRLNDLEALAVLPEPGERNAMWSSYDRAARYDADTGEYVEWYANGDGNGLIREENGNQVIAEMEGPGVIWRIWSAKPEAGHVKILIDGQVAVDMPFAHYFDAQHAPFDYATLSYESGRGKNLYFPIPYQRSCKVIAEPGWGRYYQITWDDQSEPAVWCPLGDFFGTVTEDYFGYAWGCGDLFQRPFHNQTMTEGNAGHQSVNRFQIAGNVPLQSSFDAYLEKYFLNEQPTLYAATAWWYLAPGGEDPLGPVPADQRHSRSHRRQTVG